MQRGNSPPAVVQSFVKIRPPKPFGGTSYEDIDAWIFSMELYFHTEHHMPMVLRGLHAALNLSAGTAI